MNTHQSRLASKSFKGITGWDAAIPLVWSAKVPYFGLGAWFFES